MTPPIKARLDEVLRLVDGLASITQEFERITPADARPGTDALPARLVLDAYVRAVGGLRAVVLEARRCVERTTTHVMEAEAFARRRGRRARKAAARLHAKTGDDSR